MKQPLPPIPVTLKLKLMKALTPKPSNLGVILGMGASECGKTAALRKYAELNNGGFTVHQAE